MNLGLDSSRRWGGVLLGVSVALSMLGCAAPPPEGTPPPVVEAPRQAPRAAPAPAPTAQASATESDFTPKDGAPADAPSTATVKPPEQQQATAPTPQQVPVLIGLTEGDLTRRYGQPASVRKTPAATVWTYQDAACTLELFLFTDMRSGQQKVLTYQIGGGGYPIHGDRGCLERLGVNGKGG
ncbi:MAG TPA: hypothetical protein VJ890_25520 [Vineibacter sp.]|nr:hypothetical protein [Vineibacter sp.]